MTPHIDGGGRGAGVFTPRQMKAARLLFYSGWLVTLCYFPSGLLHAMIGAGVYVRDILLCMHLFAGIFWLVKAGRFATFARRSWLLLVPAFFVLAALFNDAFTVEALTFIKWTGLWLDWIIIGSLAPMVVKPSSPALLIFLGLTALLLVADLGAGFYERVTNHYIFNVKGEISAFGVPEGKELAFPTGLRIKGFQRDVFSFANLMAMSSVAGLLTFVTFGAANIRLVALLWSGIFGLGMFSSYGRSAFFGMFAAGVVAIGLLVIPDTVRRNYGRIVVVWLVIALTISFSGVGRLTEFVGGSVLSNSAVGNARSAYARNDNWTSIEGAIGYFPVLLVSGGPIASLIDPRVEPMFHWADNQYLWFLYHCGVVGFLAICLYFVQKLRLRLDNEKPWLRDALVLYLLFVMGEGIARESMTFIGCMPLFVACGCHGDVDTDGAGSASPRRARAPVKTRADAADFARRVRKAEKEQE